VTCPHCGRTAEFHSHRLHTSFTLVGAVRYRRAYYLCRCCGKGLFPFDREAGLTTRDLTPALERVASLAGAVADSFEKGAELLEEMGGRPGLGIDRRTDHRRGRSTSGRGRQGRLDLGSPNGLAVAQGLRRPTLCVRGTRRHRGAAAR
jgi:hypothetical protein